MEDDDDLVYWIKVLIKGLRRFAAQERERLVATQNVVDTSRFRFALGIKDADGDVAPPKVLGLIVAASSDPSAAVAEDPANPGQFVVSPVAPAPAGGWPVVTITFTVGDAEPLTEQVQFTQGPAASLVATVSTEPIPPAPAVPIAPAAPVLTTVNVTPADQAIVLGSGLQLTAVTLDGAGAPIAAVVTWGLDPGALGTVNADGLYVAPAAGAPAESDAVTATAVADGVTVTGTTIVSYS